MKYLIKLSIFRGNRNFTFLYISQFVSFLGSMITGVALPYQIYGNPFHPNGWFAVFGITAFVASEGVLCVISVGLCCYFLPKFWRYDADVHARMNRVI